MMEFSVEMPNLTTAVTNSCQSRIEEIDIIDLTELNFSDDENWLFESPKKSDVDLRQWMHCHEDSSDDLFPNDVETTLEMSKSDSQKNIDTRTFTRPKKRFTRPSVEKYNEELYGKDHELTETNGFSHEKMTHKPLHFDLAQPTSSHYFENILANAPGIDSFQNMSPPSLVNSMCSSTFANLMENSYIKNDPVLREIRDTDFTQSILLQQETEPMYHSITESCSSLNSDVPEIFLKKISFNETLKNKSSINDTTICLNATFEKNDASNETFTLDDEQTNNDNHNLNGTYHEKKPKLKSTFRVADVNNGRINLNSTFQRRKNSNVNTTWPQRDTTITLDSNDSREKHDNRTIENIKRLLDRRPTPSLDLNRLSYLVEDNDSKLNATFANENLKRNSFESSDSGENLDYMSISSGSSKSSNKIMSMEGINQIVEMQERSLQQVMSTPKVHTKATVLWENNVISPISGRNSDPELSSSEKSSSRTVITTNAIKKQKSLGNIHPKEQIQPKISKFQMPSNIIRGSYPSLKTLNECKPRLQSNLCKPIQGSRSNLNSMGHTLKGSYTSLKPTNLNLPVAPPLDPTITLAKTSNVVGMEKKVAQVSPIPRQGPVKFQETQFVQPRPPRASGLPRPVTGIPRPASRIPGPRAAVRTIPKPAGHQGR